MEIIYHIASIADINTARSTGSYSCSSLTLEGFIHCCLPAQLVGVVERYYADVDDVQLLCLDPDKLHSALVFENTVGGKELFPHIYGEINMDAVLEVLPFGLIKRPAALASIH